MHFGGLQGGTAAPPRWTPVDEASLTPEHSAEELDQIVRKAIDEVLGDSRYIDGVADSWSDQILDRSLQRIAGTERPFKYIATCVISKQTGPTLDTAATAFWDTHSDSLCCIRQGNGFVDCIVTIFACRR
eukprot:TRINITY_DN44797_c0_g1_i1.p1 TRINITY_DN44797_c0_g1~~TRINITY_DN44797_c0_g1_i1.p1  ORF type:complete len:130 (-),score=16.76 TRINITY_DN44797_c0_g1_i1:110-499(-)